MSLLRKKPIRVGGGLVGWLVISLLLGCSGQPSTQVALTADEQVAYQRATDLANQHQQHARYSMYRQSFERLNTHFHYTERGRCERFDGGDYELLLQIDARGTVEKTHVKPKHARSMCMQRHLNGAKLPEPPVVPMVYRLIFD